MHKEGQDLPLSTAETDTCIAQAAQLNQLPHAGNPPPQGGEGHTESLSNLSKLRPLILQTHRPGLREGCLEASSHQRSCRGQEEQPQLADRVYSETPWNDP